MAQHEMNSSFATHYHQARDLFRREAQAALETLKSDETIEQYAHPQCGPDGRSLTTDTVWLGPETASKVLVTVSGIHGVEGFCGSGAQVDWLRRREWANLPANTAVSFVHAINPDTFAGVRSQPVSCATGAPLDAASAAVGLLVRDLLTRGFSFLWLTSRSWKGSCRLMTLALADGQTKEALLRFQ